MKKILSLVLVLSLVLGTFSFAFADGHLPEDVVGEDSEEAVATLMALGVVNGYPDGTYKPEKTVTRAEMAKLLVEAQGYGQLAAGSTASFSDAQGHWAESYIGFAASMNIVVGYPDGTFKPDATMTIDEAMTMVIRALGYTDASIKGTWPTNYKVKALDLELTDGLSALSGGAARGDVAMLLFNALEVNLVEVNSDDEAVKDEDRLFIDRIGKKVDMSEEENAADQIVQPEDVYGDDAWDTAIDMTPYLFHTLTYYLNADDEVAYVSEVQTNELAGTVVATTPGAITLDDDDDTEFDVAGAPLFLNGDEASVEADTLDVDQADVTVVYDEDDNDKVLGVVAWDYELKTNVNYSTRTPLALSRGSSKDLPAMENDDDDLVLDEENLTIEGDVDKLEDIDTDDLVYYYASEDESDEYPGKVKLLVVRDTFEGKYTKKVDSDTWVFGGEELDKSVDAVSSWTKTPTLGTEYKLVLDKNGDLYDIQEATDDTTVDEDYALFIKESDGVLVDEAGVYIVDTMPKVRLFTAGGDDVLYEIDIADLEDETDDWTTDGAIELSDTAGNFKVQYVAGTTNIDVTVNINEEDLVEYTLNDDGQLDSIETFGQTYDTVGYDRDNMLLDDSYDVVDDTVIFSVQGASNWTDWTVEEETYLTDEETNDLEINFIVDTDDYFVKVIVVNDGGDQTDPDTVYAMITDYAEAYDEEQDEAVFEITALVDGEEVIYLTEDASAADADIYDPYVDNVDLAVLTFDDGLVEKVEKADDVDTDKMDFVVDEIEGMKLRSETDGKLYTITEDASVFLVDGTDVETVTFDDILSGDNVELYDKNSDGEFGVVVITIQ